MIAQLVTDLGRCLEDGLQGFLLEHPETGAEVAPPVYIGGLPDDLGGVEAFPCVVVAWESVEDDEDDSLISAEVTLCMSSNSGSKSLEEWAAGFTDRVRSILRDVRVLENKFERQWPVRIRRPDPRREQHRYAVVVLTTTWRRPAPRQTVEGFDL